ncbi:rod shape-determining protein MreD [Nodosilinea sp. E11]|uniref:rod shape-determining protein MreD n=1 Tax=Nodosilinea sp. E11 TaxID=3037479 RepID=UPI002934FED6|nr:rod shape-determining protein MreD [Nodosilinea sp. E11]WOD41460.1 rod shape-determining protein MreD [Nodosilinea sp. E11]
MTQGLRVASLPLWRRPWVINSAVTAASVGACLLLLPSRIPGMQLLGVTPHWLLIWVVAWSIKRTQWEAAIAGLVLGLLQDAMTSPDPTHTLSLIVVGVLTARLQKQRYLQEDIVSVALIVFAMAVIAETVLALQISFHQLISTTSLYPPLGKIWLYHQRIALSSAILSSLWAPALYYPLNRWWDRYPSDG